jgi:hypothetical protein
MFADRWDLEKSPGLPIASSFRSPVSVVVQANGRYKPAAANICEVSSVTYARAYASASLLVINSYVGVHTET